MWSTAILLTVDLLVVTVHFCRDWFLRFITTHTNDCALAISSLNRLFWFSLLSLVMSLFHICLIIPPEPLPP